MKGDHDRSILSYCVIEFAYDGVTCVNASPRIYRNRIEGNYWNGILCHIVSNPKINNNQILNNGYAGINTKINSTPSISGNEITGNRFGVLIQDVSKPVIGDVKLGENSGKNAIYGNLEYNLYNHTKNVIYAQRNDWGDNTNADRLIKDDDENAKHGIVVYAPVFASGKISYLEYQSLSSGVTTNVVDDKAQKQKEIEELKKKIEESKKQQLEKTTAGTVIEDKSKEEQARLLAEQEKEKERLRLLEEQLKQQEQIRIEQEKQLALKKKEEDDRKRMEEEQKKKAALEKKETAVATTFIAPKMANELDKNPKVISKVNPVLPKEAQQAKVSGTVSLRVLVGLDGKAKEMYVAKRIGNKDFDKMIEDDAKASVKKWVFEVGQFEGKNVEYWMVVNMLYK
jgi:outer membrane biosynthesis protein TonB